MILREYAHVAYRAAPAAELLGAGAQVGLGACTVGLAPRNSAEGHPVYDDPRPFPRRCTPVPPGGGGEASPPRHSPHCSRSLNRVVKPIWRSHRVLIVTSPVTPADPH